MRIISKKAFCVLLALAILLQFVPAPAFAATNNVSWKVKDEVLTISGTGEIPEDLRSAFEDEYFTSVVISEGITAIGDGKDGEWGSGLFNMLPITSVSLPKSLEYIGVAAFAYCWALEEIEIPDRVTTIGDYAFRECLALQNVVIGDSLTTIGASAFEDCSGLQKITIPAHVTSIGKRAFYRCYDLRIYGYPGSCAETHAGEYRIPFSYAEDVVVDNLSWRVKDDVLTISGTGTIPVFWRPFEDEQFTKVVIAEGITAIGNDTFEGNSGLLSGFPVTSVILPNSLKFIGNAAFADCDDLKGIQIPDGVTAIGDCAFYFCWNLEEIVLPDGVTSIGDDAFCGCDHLERVVLGDSLTSIGDSAFEYCENLTEITIPESVTFIGEDAFYECDLIIYGYPGSYAEAYAAEHWIPFSYADDAVVGNLSWGVEDGVLTISGTGTIPAYWHPFAGEQFTSVVISEGITAIEDGTSSSNLFSRLPITSVTLPNSMEHLGDFAFYYCSDLTRIVIPDRVTVIGEFAFCGCAALADVELGNSLTEIEMYAFSNCKALTEIEIPERVTSIDEKAFENEFGLKIYGKTGSIAELYAQAYEIPFVSTGAAEEELLSWSVEDGVLTITGTIEIPAYWRPFAGEQFTSVVISEGITAIGDSHNWKDGLFSGLPIKSVILPSTLESIGDFAFSGCTSLSEVGIPASVTHIQPYAFDGCSDLTLYVEAGSYAESYAIEQGINYCIGKLCFHVWEGMYCSLCGSVYTPFTDVPANQFYYAPVIWAVENGITTGATADTFNPNGTCLRAQVVTFLHRAAGNPIPADSSNPFADVKSSDFFYAPVLWAVEKGITNGVSATEFGSYANCNRAAVVTFLWRAAGSPEPESTENPFTDVKNTDFFYKPVLWAIENGITNGLSATEFGPTANCNRAQVVTFLHRAYT